MLGNGVVGILSETSNKWERRAPLTPADCARFLLAGRHKSGVVRVIVQPSTKRYLNLGYSTPFLTLGAAYMYPSLVAAKAAVISVGEEIATQGLPSGICPLVFVFAGSGNARYLSFFLILLSVQVVYQDLFGKAKDSSEPTGTSKRDFQVYGCIATYADMVKHKDAMGEAFDKGDYHANPDNYIPIFHEKIAPYASVIYMEGNGVICSVVDNLPTEFAKEASQHFGGLLSQFIGSLSSTADITKLPANLRRACIAHGGALTSLYEYIPHLRNSGFK
ncbi:hypothetical protein QYF36_019795 [Acer negundo]|nr:hypothetical protein QYF36_019795 [Acer negundo]